MRPGGVDTGGGVVYHRGKLENAIELWYGEDGEE